MCVSENRCKIVSVYVREKENARDKMRMREKGNVCEWDERERERERMCV